MAHRRNSRQRELLLETLQNTKCHPSAERLYEWLKPEHPKLSLGTVYRNLRLLCQEGRIARIVHDVDHYDAELGEHAHLLCRACGEVYDIDCSLPQGGFPPSEHKLERRAVLFYGLCRDCTSDNH